MKKIIAIIGCGAVGAAQLHHVVETLIDENIAEFFEILIFEKSPQVGRGMAYNYDVDSNILNRTADSMSIIHNKPYDFYNWLKNNKNKWKIHYPNIKDAHLKNKFLPRSLFGMYIEDTLSKITIKARLYKLKISIIHDEVISIESKHSQYNMKTSNGWFFYTDYAILCIGHLNSNKFDNLHDNKKYFSTPYPSNKLNFIHKYANIGIIGSRLSAIDTVIYLANNNHKGKISLIARQGYLPTVRTKLTSFKLKILTNERLQEMRDRNEKLSLRKIVYMIIKEINMECKSRLVFKNWFNRSADPVEFYECEFNNVNKQSSIMPQSILVAFNQLIEEVWNDLSDSEKAIFNKTYKSKWMAYRVGIPLKNAKKIFHLFKTEQLSLIKGFLNFKYNDDHFLVNANNNLHKFDYIVNASGNCEDLKFIDSALISNMIKTGMIKPNKFGGIEVDFANSNLIKENQTIEKNIFVIGNLTSGTYFFTSVLELNVKHAVKIAKYIASDFMSLCRFHENSSYDMSIPYCDKENIYMNKQV